MTATLKIESFSANSSPLVDHTGITGDDHGGIALSNDRVFISGDGSTGIVSAANLTGGASLNKLHDGLFSDLATGKVYVLAKNATTPLSYPTGSFFQGETITHIIELDGVTGALTSNVIALSTPLVLASNNSVDAGIFSGAGRLLIQDDLGAVSEIALPTGVVTSLGTQATPTHRSTEAWAYWGVAEHFDGADYLTYVQSRQSIARTRVGDGVTSVVSSFSNLGEIASIVAAPTRQRWYFHQEGTSQFGGSAGDEFVGYADATISVGVDFATITPDPRAVPLGSIEVTFDAPIAANSFTVSDLVLTRDGQTVSLAGGASINFVSGNTYRIDGLAAANSADGHYLLSLPYGSVTSAVGEQYGGQTTWTVDAVLGAPTVVSTTPTNGGTLIATSFSSLTVTFSEIVRTAAAQDTHNYRLTGPNGTIPITSAVLDVDGKTVTLTLPTQTTAGSYSLAVGNLQDVVGNAMPALSTVNPTPIVTTLTSEAVGPFLQTLADFDGDLIKDLIVVRGSDFKDLLFLKGNADGTFAATTVFDNVAQSSPLTQLTSADLDGDGNQDLIVAEQFSGARIMFGLGNGAFGTPQFIALSSAASVKVGDLNGDLRPDVVIAGQGGTARALLNNGTTTVSSWTVVDSSNSYGYSDFALIDMNTDGNLDFVGSLGSSVHVNRGNGSGGFTSGPSFLHQGGFPDTFTVADLDGDGLQDFIAGGNGTAIHYGIPRPVGNQLAQYFANSAQFLGSNPGQQSRHVEAVDLDGDGDLDLIKGSSNFNVGTGAVFISWNQGNRTFVNQTIDLVANGFNSNMGTFTLSFEDLNNDTIPEIIVAPFSGNKIFTLYSQAQAPVSTFTLQTNFPPTTPSDTNGANNQVNEGAAPGTTVGITVNATDPEAGSIAYSLSSNPNSLFAIDATSGVVTVAAGAVLNRASGAIGTITVRATDPANFFSETQFTINILDVAPTVSLAPSYQATDSGSVLLTATGSDAAGTSTFAWDLDNDGQFDDGAGDNVSYVAATFGNSLGQHPVSVRITDDEGTSTIATSVVDVVDDDSTGPTITVIGNASFTDVQNVAFDVTSTDASGIAQVTVTITKGAATVYTQIYNPSSGTPFNVAAGQLATTYGLGLYSVTINATDADNDRLNDSSSTADTSYTFTIVPNAIAPTVTTPTATNIGLTSATLGGNVTADGGATITERGIVYSITALNNNPQIGGTAVVQLTAPGTTGTFTIDVSALPTGTQFSYAAYATNTVGTTYTTIGTFTTQPAIGQFPGITVQVLNGQMIVTGTAQDDTIRIASDGMGGYIVTANKLINGLPSPQTFTGATSIVANTLGGNDDLWLAAPLTFNDVTVDLGAGNDRLVLGADPNNAINNNVLDPQFGTLGYLTVNGPVSVTGGEGNDRVIERSTEINGIKTISLGEGNNEYNVYWGFSNETNFSSGAGNDNVYIGYLSSRQASQFDTGAGNDLISYYASRFYKTAYLNSGVGYDTVALDVNIYDDATTVDTGSEADYLLFSRSVAYSSVTLTTSGGADYILIGKYISGLNSSGAAVYSNGGSNIDQLTLNTGAEVDSVQIAANVMRLFYANLGDAYDDADVSYNLFTDGLLDGGGQDMRLRLRGNANLRTRNPTSV